MSSPARPAGDDSERLSMDGHSSELEEDDEEEAGGGQVSQCVPQTPDQEAFLKEHFVTLADLSGTGSPSRASHSSSESLSISSRFLSQNSAGSRSVLPLPSRTTDGGGGGGGGGEAKSRLLVSEVRPLMEKSQNWTKERRVSWQQDQTQKQDQDKTVMSEDQTQSQNRTNQDQTNSVQIQKGLDQIQSWGEDKDTSHSQQTNRPLTPKKIPAESKKNQSPVTRAATPHMNSSSSSGLRKAQSVQSLLVPTGDPALSHSASRPSREVPPQLLHPQQRPTTLPTSPRRFPCVAPSQQRPSPASPRSPLTETASTPAQAAGSTPRKSSSSSSSSSSAPSTARSYMSPTASSMAKMSRSVSMGDGLNLSEPVEGPAVTSSITPASEVRESAPPLVAVVPSNATLAATPHAAVVPVVITSTSSSLSNHGNQGTPPPRGLQSRVPGSNRPLPDKPSIASLSSPSRPPPVSVSPLTPSRQEAEPQAASDAEDQRDVSGEPVSIESCRVLTNELQNCFRRATHLYRKVSGSSFDDSASDQQQIAVILSEAFQAMRVELDCLPMEPLSILGGERGLGGVGEVKTAALLEEYSLLLLQAVNRRVNAPPE